MSRTKGIGTKPKEEGRYVGKWMRKDYFISTYHAYVIAHCFSSIFYLLLMAA
jgi:hypothetical protein